MRITHKNQSTDAELWDGVTCSSDEVFVMKMERRGYIFKQMESGNWGTKSTLETRRYN